MPAILKYKFSGREISNLNMVVFGISKDTVNTTCHNSSIIEWIKKTAPV